MMEKMDGMSMDLTIENIEKIKELFPNAVTEGKIDFDILRTVLGDEIDSSKEKYQFTWNGKAESIKLAQSPSTATLRPCIEKSTNWETTSNLYIEGDNLEVLKQLQKTYFGKIKMIYIDPPYNTGTDFVYKDNFKDSIENYKQQTLQSASSNPSTSGRFHARWLNMMYPRLLLARNLLSDEGAIFIHIDEHEVASLEMICDEIFGAQNKLGTIIWDKRNPKGVVAGVAYQHESILAYCKSISVFAGVSFSKKKEHAEGMLSKAEGIIKKYGGVTDAARKEYKEYIKANKNDLTGGESAYNLIDDSGRVYRPVSMAAPDKPETRSHRPLIHPVTGKPCGVPAKGWRFTDQTMDEMVASGKIEFGVDESTVPNQKYYLEDNLWEAVASLLYFGGSDDAMGLPFDNPKPVYVAKKLISSLCKNDGDTVLDFFSGSATAAHAVMELNSEDAIRRKFIMVQLPELTEEKSEAYKAGFKNICEIGEERIRRAGESIARADLLGQTLDTGFKVFALDSTNINPWDNRNEYDEGSLFNTATVFKLDRSKEDILYEIMLKYGVFDQTTSEIDVNGKTMYRVGQRHMIVCLEDKIDEKDVEVICKLQPKVVVFKEDGFKDDNAKINAEYNLTKAGIEDVKAI